MSVIKVIAVVAVLAAVVIIAAAVGGTVLTVAAVNWAYRERW